jgi:hypothetical protein
LHLRDARMRTKSPPSGRARASFAHRPGRDTPVVHDLASGVHRGRPRELLVEIEGHHCYTVPAHGCLLSSTHRRLPPEGGSLSSHHGGHGGPRKTADPFTTTRRPQRIFTVCSAASRARLRSIADAGRKVEHVAEENASTPPQRLRSRGTKHTGRTSTEQRVSPKRHP